MTRKRKIVLTTLIFLTPLVLLFGISAIINFQESRRLSQPLADPRHGFTLYKPMYFPGDLTTTGEIIDTSTKKNSFTSVIYFMNLGTRDWIYSIREMRAEPSNSQEVKTQETSFEPNSMQPTCMQKETLKKQSYRLCHWFTGDVSAYEIKFIKDNIYIRALLPTDSGKPYSLSDLDKFVDSFQKSEPKEDIEISNNTI